MEHPDQAPAFTPTVRTPQCGHTVWRNIYIHISRRRWRERGRERDNICRWRAIQPNIPIQGTSWFLQFKFDDYRYNHYVKLDLGEVGYKTHYKGLGVPWSLQQSLQAVMSSTHILVPISRILIPFGNQQWHMEKSSLNNGGCSIATLD